MKNLSKMLILSGLMLVGTSCASLKTFVPEYNIQLPEEYKTNSEAEVYLKRAFGVYNHTIKIQDLGNGRYNLVGNSENICLEDSKSIKNFLWLADMDENKIITLDEAEAFQNLIVGSEIEKTKPKVFEVD